MTNINLYNSKNWIEYLDNHFDDCLDYFKFAMIWMSFNSYYAIRYKHITGEFNQVIEFSKDNEVIYQKLLSEGSFSNIISDFENTKYLDGSGPRKKVIDMRNGSGKECIFDGQHKSFEDFLKVIYQIRCNFFHGDKTMGNEYDKKLINWAYNYFSIVWKECLQNNNSI